MAIFVTLCLQTQIYLPESTIIPRYKTFYWYLATDRMMGPSGVIRVTSHGKYRTHEAPETWHGSNEKVSKD